MANQTKPDPAKVNWKKTLLLAVSVGVASGVIEAAMNLASTIPAGVITAGALAAVTSLPSVNAWLRDE